MMVPIVITAIVTLLIAVPVTALIASAQCKKGIEQKIGNADDKAREIIDEALKTAEAKKRDFVGAEAIYLGWIMAGSVKGCAGAAKRYQVCAVCGVGMGQTGTQTDSVRKKSEIPANIPLFTLQGNFNVKKLHGIYRFMMEIMVKTVGKALAAKKDRTPEQDDILHMMLHGGERVKTENLSAILDWYRAQQ